MYASCHHNGRLGNGGITIESSKLVLRGGSITGNAAAGVVARLGAKITVAKAVEGKPLTIVKDNTRFDWHTYGRPWNMPREMIGIPQAKINV